MASRGWIAGLCLAALSGLGLPPADAAVCSTERHNDNRYTVCRVSVPDEDLRLFLLDDTGAPYGQFSAVHDALEAQGLGLQFAMNGGMYHDDRSPVGHYIEDGTELMRVIPNAGPGNFGLLPNGVFCIQDDQARVIETTEYLETKPTCRFATQSGPMLVIDGALHPKFLPDSTSYNIRNGVGTSADGKTAVFVISDTSVTFHAFASFFRDALGLPNALFLDGSVSRLWAPGLGRADIGRWLGPMVGVVQPLPVN